jgi:UDP-N-acetyl-D-glucosamine dehydrogenase
MYKKILINKIKQKSANVGIIGLGYVGLPLSSAFLNIGFKVYGFDIDIKKIKKLNKGKIYIENINSHIFKTNKNKFIVSKINKNIRNCDVIVICVPTPVTSQKKPDLRPVKKTVSFIMPFLKKGQLIVLESSTYPGTTKELIGSKIEKKFSLGKNFFIGYSPEREDPGNKNFNLKNTPKITSGLTEACKEITNFFYKQIVNKIVPVSSVETAEFTKLYENSFRSINIALVNEAKMLCKKIDINIDEVIEAAKTKPFGFSPFYPGPGVGGHCIPVDPLYLSWIAKKNGLKMDFINLAGRINHQMPDWIFKNIKKTFKIKKIENPKILLIGIAYKKDLGDYRESPSLKLIKIFIKENLKFSYHDKFVKKIQTKEFKNKFKSITLDKSTLKKFDATIIMTDHNYLNKDLIQKNSKIIFDTRNFFKRTALNIIKL